MTKTVKHFDVLDEGTIVLITPLTARAKTWIKEHVCSESWQWMGGGLVVDHRYADDILFAADGDLNPGRRRTQ